MRAWNLLPAILYFRTDFSSTTDIRSLQMEPINMETFHCLQLNTAANIYYAANMTNEENGDFTA